MSPRACPSSVLVCLLVSSFAAGGEVGSMPGVVLNRDAGEAARVAIDWSQADEIPAPEAAQVRAGEGGDIVLAPAAGDPFFLGFASGPYYPPRAERIDPDLLRSIDPRSLEERPRQATYAFVMLGKRITPERVAALESSGATV